MGGGRLVKLNTEFTPAVTIMDKNRLYTENSTDLRKYRIDLSTTIFRTIIESIQMESIFFHQK